MSLSPSVFARVFVLIAVFASLAACGFEGQTTITRTPHPDLDPTGIDDLLKAIRGERYGQVHSVLLTIDGELVLEAYFHDYSRNQRQALYSVTKSYLSALIGIAIQEGHIQSVDDRVLPYFPEYPDLANVGPEKESLTIEHLLTMTAGFDWNELS
ncbi:MAG: serine hydrolase, partial [bacterium]|nr:serine hydrolase [bacterium]